MSLAMSQKDLADELCAVSGRPTMTREEISRYENEKRCPGPFWMPHFATVLRVPLSVLESAKVRRREFLTAAALAPLVPAAVRQTADEICYSIAGGDSSPLTTVQTSHQTDLLISALTTQDRSVVRRLTRWMIDGESDVLRVNATGILAKVTSSELSDGVALSLDRDSQVRARYLSAVKARIGQDRSTVIQELGNLRDSGARWCAAFLLAQDRSREARQALAGALHTEPARENLRAIARALNGALPCM